MNASFTMAIRNCDHHLAAPEEAARRCATQPAGPVQLKSGPAEGRGTDIRGGYQWRDALGSAIRADESTHGGSGS